MNSTYVIGHLEGLRAHFIASMLFQLHCPKEAPMKYADDGHAHFNSHYYYSNYTNSVELGRQGMSQYERFYRLKVVSESDSPLILHHILSWNIDFEKLSNTHNNIKYLFIVPETDDLLEMLANSVYKTRSLIDNHAPEIAKSRLSIYHASSLLDDHCRKDVDSLCELSDHELMILIKTMKESERKSAVDVINEVMSCIPKTIDVHIIKYGDILADKNKTLTTLEKITGKHRTKDIEDSYDNYLSIQQELCSNSLAWVYAQNNCNNLQ